jgi:ketosteroid isomerase-like protein
MKYNKIKAVLPVLIILIIILNYAFTVKSIQSDKQELITADTEFSNLSAEKGMHEAFLAYMDENVVMLKPYQYPIVGKEKQREIYAQNPDTGFTLTWKPSFADISQSGELGYTYGIWEITTKDSTGKEVKGNGTYATVWKKDSEGKWKFVLDTGNPGLEPKQ